MVSTTACKLRAKLVVMEMRGNVTYEGARMSEKSFVRRREDHGRGRCLKSARVLTFERARRVGKLREYYRK